MQNIKIKAQKRNDIGGGHVKRLRKNGMVPAVIYGKNIESSPIQVSMSDLRKLVATGGQNAFFTLEIDGAEHAAIIKNIQYGVVKNDVLHVDIRRFLSLKRYRQAFPSGSWEEKRLRRAAGLSCSNWIRLQ